MSALSYWTRWFNAHRSVSNFQKISLLPICFIHRFTPPKINSISTIIFFFFLREFIWRIFRIVLSKVRLGFDDRFFEKLVALFIRIFGINIFDRFINSFFVIIFCEIYICKFSLILWCIEKKVMKMNVKKIVGMKLLFEHQSNFYFRYYKIISSNF